MGNITLVNLYCKNSQHLGHSLSPLPLGALLTVLESSLGHSDCKID